VKLGSQLRVEISSVRTNESMEVLTIVAAKDEVVDWLQTKEGKEIPGQTGYPSYVQVASSDAGLEHRLELRCQWEGQFHCEARSANIPV
jgi:hypothetical protein